jgi:hypothetical protein
MTITYVTDGPWGTGTGVPHTAAEADGIIYELATRVQELESSPPEAVSIDSFTVDGTQLTVHLTDGSSQGPFTLPSATWRDTGAWQPSTLYFVNDLFAKNGALWRVLVQHTSEATFDPELFSGSGFVYSAIFVAPDQPYDIGMNHGDILPGDGSILMEHVFVRNVVLEAGFPLSAAILNVAVADGDISLPIYRNDDVIGFIEFTLGAGVLSPSGSQLGTFVPLSPAVDIQFVRFDRLKVGAPLPGDSAAAGLAVTFAARTGVI